MQQWLREKLDAITKDFLAGNGLGIAFEAQYLVYLESLVAFTQGISVSEHVWDEWHKVCSNAAPTGERVYCLSFRVSNREELVKALQKLRKHFLDPIGVLKRQVRKAHPVAVETPPVQVQAPSLQDFLFGSGDSPCR